jgi:7-carboxy-7-deazaguanine synthase
MLTRTLPCGSRLLPSDRAIIRVVYSVKEIFHTLQGEGMNAGRPAVFLRFAGCNLWSGRESDRPTAVCRFCDTEFVGTDGDNGGRFPTAASLAARVSGLWRGAREERFVVCTGGEPLLQLDSPLIAALHEEGFRIAIETNGTLPVPAAVDWVCVSPKAAAPLVVHGGDELKLVYPQEGADPEHFEHLDFRHFLVQPMDGPDRERNTRLAVEFCRARPRCRLSLQTHKMNGIR